MARLDSATSLCFNGASLMKKSLKIQAAIIGIALLPFVSQAKDQFQGFNDGYFVKYDPNSCPAQYYALKGSVFDAYEILGDNRYKTKFKKGAVFDDKLLLDIQSKLQSAEAKVILQMKNKTSAQLAQERDTTDSMDFPPEYMHDPIINVKSGIRWADVEPDHARRLCESAEDLSQKISRMLRDR
jgi:hypothetical protein